MTRRIARTILWQVDLETGARSVADYRELDFTGPGLFRKCGVRLNAKGNKILRDMTCAGDENQFWVLEFDDHCLHEEV